MEKIQFLKVASHFTRDQGFWLDIPWTSTWRFGKNPFTQFITFQHISSGFSPCLPRWLSLKTYLHHPKLAQECTRLQVIRYMHSAQHKQWLPHFALKREAFEWFESILKVRRSSFYRFWTSCKSAVEPRPCCFHAAPKETTRFSLWHN